MIPTTDNVLECCLFRWLQPYHKSPSFPRRGFQASSTPLLGGSSVPRGDGLVPAVAVYSRPAPAFMRQTTQFPALSVYPSRVVSAHVVPQLLAAQVIITPAATGRVEKVGPVLRYVSAERARLQFRFAHFNFLRWVRHLTIHSTGTRFAGPVN